MDPPGSPSFTLFFFLRQKIWPVGTDIPTRKHLEVHNLCLLQAGHAVPYHQTSSDPLHWFLTHLALGCIKIPTLLELWTDGSACVTAYQNEPWVTLYNSKERCFSYSALGSLLFFFFNVTFMIPQGRSLCCVPITLLCRHVLILPQRSMVYLHRPKCHTQSHSPPVSQAPGKKREMSKWYETAIFLPFMH